MDSMTEIIFVLAATVFVFSLFLLVFFIKDRSDRNERGKATCARCDCHRSQERHVRPDGHPKHIETSERSR